MTVWAYAPQTLNLLFRILFCRFLVSCQSLSPLHLLFCSSPQKSFPHRSWGRWIWDDSVISVVSLEHSVLWLLRVPAVDFDYVHFFLGWCLLTRGWNLWKGPEDPNSFAGVLLPYLVLILSGGAMSSSQPRTPGLRVSSFNSDQPIWPWATTSHPERLRASQVEQECWFRCCNNHVR